ncbi:MAG TPA: hypothetical protein VGS62_04010 [Streptosporangiaceae bacterium]|nr:hypothetical protein [Streptosporangiaceae bacterium]
MDPPTARMRIDAPADDTPIPGLTGPPRRARVTGWSVDSPGRRPDQNRRAVTAGIGLAILITIGIIAYLLTAGLQHASGRPVAGTGRAHAHSKHGSHATPPPTPQASHPATGSSSSPPPPATQALVPVSVSAFGSGGRPGDDPGGAAAAIGHNPASRWHTDWYTTANFGNLYPGTGLLLDMGKAVTITSARITLGSTPGASFQLRVGNAPSLPGLRPVAAASGAGGVVRLQASSPAPGRYVLIWFTKLPPDSTGTFQASVYDISLQGHP